MLPFLATACVCQKSEVATKFGYHNSTKVAAGPYQLHYGKNGADDFLLLAHGDWNLYSRTPGEGTDVYLDGKPFLHFERNPNGSLTNLQMQLPGSQGRAGIVLMDRNADGEWDLKIDKDAEKTFIWQDGHWLPR